MSKMSLDETKYIKVLLSQVRAFRDTVQDILNNEKAVEHSRYVAYRDMACMYNDFAEQVKAVLKVPSMIYSFNTAEMKGYTSTLWGDFAEEDTRASTD